MADNLIFPIGFDLDKAVADASKEWDSTYAAKLEKALTKKPVSVKLKLDTKNLDSLDAVKKRLSELKVEPITPETKTAIKELTSELRQLAKALETLQKYSKNPTKGAVDTSKVQLNEARAKAQAALAAQRTAKAEDNLAAARLKAARAANVHASATRNASKAYSEQSTYLKRLTQRMAAYWSIQQVGSFLTNVREVTAQFELQRVSLGAIIQDQNRANALFSEIKNFALKSPVKIMDLTKYTKQLAAYKIGWDGVKTDTEELFETTKKLTDVSVGLGASMDRVVLAYGQVRARGALYASEIRQFTEMGIPIVEELAAKLSKVNGELVTSKDVLGLVSKGAISFELVKEVFDDMTSVGGMFYNMQEKQGNTLFGMWAKLGDAASVMYDKIGRSETVNKGMKETIQLLTDMMRNWEMVARYIGYASVVIAGFVIRKKILGIETAKVAAIQQTYNVRMMQANMLASSNSRLIRAQGVAMGVYAQSMRFASTMAAAFGTSLQAIKSALITIGWGALIAALGYIVDKLFFTQSNAEKTAEALNNVWSETRTQQDQSVRNFEYLADKAVKAAAGSKEQKEALEELQRTYKDILPQEVLELEYLEKLKGNYGSLTQAIREYVAERQKQKGIDEIADVYGAEKRKYESQLTDFFRESGLSEQEIARFWERFYKIAGDKSKQLTDIVADALQAAGVKGISADLIQKSLISSQGLLSEFNKSTYKKLGFSAGKVYTIDLLRDAILAENQALEQNDERAKAAAESTNAFAKAQEDAATRVRNVRFVDAGGRGIDRDSYLGQQMLKNFDIKEMTNLLKNGFAKIGLAWDDGFNDFIKKVDSKKPELISTLNFDAIIDSITKALNRSDITEAQRRYLQDLLTLAQTSQQRYKELAPANATVAQIRTKLVQISESFGLSMDRMKKYLWDGSSSVDDYLKRLKEQQEELKNILKEKAQTIKNMGMLSKIWNQLQGKDLEAEYKQLEKEIDALDKQITFTQQYVRTDKEKGKGKKKSGGKKDDPRLSILQEMVSTLKQVNKEYDELAKKEGVTKALADTQSKYESTFKYLRNLSTKYKFNLPNLGVPTDTASLVKYLEAAKAAMKKLPKHEKAVLSIETEIADINIDEQQRKIEEQLKRISDNISRTKTAKEFYDRILNTTGDVELAMSVSMGIYGDASVDTSKYMQQYIMDLFGSVGVSVPIEVVSNYGEIDYTAMEKFVRENEKLLGDNYKELLKIAQDGQKDLARVYEGYLKDLEVAKTYADKRIELARYTSNKVTEIEEKRAEAKRKLALAEYQGDEDEIKRLKAEIASYEGMIERYNEREAREAAKLEYEAFKDTPLYVQMFEDLDYASTSALTRMRDRLVALKDQWKNLGPENIKEMQKRLEEIDSQLAARNPFKTLADAYKKWRDMRKSGRTKEGDEVAAVNAEKERKAAWDKMMADEKSYELAVKTHGEKSKEAQAAREAADASKEAYENAEKGADEAANNANEWKKIADKARNADGAIRVYTEKINEAAEGIRGMLDAFGASDEDKQFFEDIVGGLNKIAKGGEQAAESFARFSSGDIFGGITAGVGAVGNIVSGFTDLFSAGRVRRANKEIKKQAEILSQLEYSYGRLQKAQEEVFGSDYIQNYYQQQQNLQAQVAAKEKQLQAERSKGKKKDKEAIKQYEQQIKELKDEIADMQSHLSEYFLGSDITQAARDFASSWLDAKKSFESTTDAMRDKFKDMVQNMIIEAMAGAVMKNALQPFYDAINEAAADGELSATDIASAVQVGLKGIDDMNNGMEVLWEQLKAAGVDVNNLLTDKQDGYTGIAKDVAGATSEEINAVASIGNTVMYHTSFLPLIYQQLVAQAGGNTTHPTQQAQVGWTDWQQQAMSSYLAIQQNTADTVVECRRSAQACENIANQFSRIIKVKGSTTGINTFLNN